MSENTGVLDNLFGKSACSEQHDSEGFFVLNRRNPNDPNIPTSESTEANRVVELIPTKLNDPIRLKNDVECKLRQLFKERKQTFFEGQYEALHRVNELVLRAPSNSITAVPLVPGGGKSTYIRALLYVLSEHFANIRKDPIAKHIGGVVVVVETSAEAHQLETICVNAGGDSVVAVVEGINDSNLCQYGCPIGKAQSYSDCPRRSCDNYDYCNLAQSAFRTNETPILIMPHARYQRYLENMADLATWTDAKEEDHSRTLLLVDELPNLFESNELSMESIRGAEAELEGLMIPHNAKQRGVIRSLLCQWEWRVRIPFLKLMGTIAEAQCTYGLVQSDAFKDAGFNIDQLKKLRKALAEKSPDCAAVKVIDTVLADRTGFFGNDRSTSVVSLS